MIFGFAVITAVISLHDGMSQSVYRAAENHYAGHIFILGFSKKGGGHIIVEKDKEIIEAVHEAELSPVKIVRRTNYFDKGVLYFNGTAVRQKYVYGVDWNTEKEDFLRLDISSGNVESFKTPNSIIISKPVAERLRARIGDEIILEVLTRTGQKNTGKFIVKAIVDDTSIFGYYKCFVHRRTLNSLLGYEPDEYSSLGLFFDSLRGSWEKNEKLYTALDKRIRMGTVIRNKNELTRQMDAHWEGVLYLTFPLHVYVSQVADLLTALEAVSYFFYFMMILIILLSLFVTYRLILRERTVEMGTMRVIGIRSRDVQVVLILEMGYVFILAILIGLGVSKIIVLLLRLFPYSSIPGFAIFLQKGKLVADYSLQSIGINIAILFLILLPAVWVPAFSASRRPLSDSIRGEKK